MKEGKQAIKWDGKANNGSDKGKGEYSFRVNAVDDKSVPIKVKQSTAGLVSGVVFESGKPLLIIGDAKVPFDSVERIENPAPVMPLNNGAKELTKKTAEGEETAMKNVKPSTGEESEDNKTKNIQNDQLHSKTGSEKITEGDIASQESDDGGIPFTEGMDLWSPYN